MSQVQPRRLAASVQRYAWAALPLWLGLFAACRPLANPDEGRYTDIARWMVRSGDWLVPRLDGLPFLHKPPLYYWLEGAVIHLLGPGLYPARIVSLAAGLFTCWLMHLIVARLSDRDAARWAVAVLATSPLFFGAAQYASIDMLLTAMVTATIACSILALTTPGPARRLWVLAYTFAALGLLTKGLIGIVFPGLIVSGWLVATGQARKLWSALSVPGLIVFAAIALPWFVAMEQTFPGFNAYLFGYQQFTRFVGSEFNNQFGLYFYPLILLATQLPWSALLLAHARAVYAAHDRRGLFALGAIWLGFVMVFFSIPESKLVGYIFPMLPPAALMASPWLARWRWRKEALAAAMLCCVLFGIGGWKTLKHGPADLAPAIAGQIKADDELVFTNTYYFDLAVALDRRRPSLLVGRWNIAARDLPDSLERQLMEGKEFEPAAAVHVLITQQEFLALMDSNRSLYVVVGAGIESTPLFERWPVVASNAYWRIVRVGGARDPKE